MSRLFVESCSECEGDMNGTACLDGYLYGTCDSEYCYGACEEIGICSCKCHDKVGTE